MGTSIKLQLPNPGSSGVIVLSDLLSYVKANDAVMRNMQTQGQNMQNQLTTLTDMLSKFVASNTASTSGTLPSNTVTNPKEDLKGITTRSGVAYKGPAIPITSSSPKVMERDTEVTKDTMHPTNNGSTEDVPPPVVPLVNHESISEPSNTPVSASRPNQKASIPFPSRRNDERRREKANDQIEKFYEIFRDLSFEISFTDALMLMPKFASTLKTLIGNKEKLSEMARTPLNENCSAVILNKLPKRTLEAPAISPSLNFPGFQLHALPCADLGAALFLMANIPLEKLFSFRTNPSTGLTLELADRSISEPIGIAEDVYVTVGKFQFPADFVVVDFEPDPRVPLILGRSFLKTSRALIDVYEVGNPTPYYDPIVFTSSPYLNSIGDSDFLLSKKPTISLALGNDPTSPDVCIPTFYDPDRGYFSFEAISPVNHSHNLKEILSDNREKILRFFFFCEANRENSSVNGALSLKLKDLPPHWNMNFWRVTDKSMGKPVIEYQRRDGMTVVGTKMMINDLGYDSIGHRIPIDPKDQEKTTFTCPYGTFAYRRMPFGLCNAPGTFQRCMMAIFHDMIEKTMEVFMDDFSVFGDSFSTCLTHLDKMLKRCEDTNLVLNWEKSHFMVKEGIVLGHKISKSGIEVDRAKVDVIAKLPHPTTVKGVRIFFSKECIESFNTLKRKLTEAPILIAPDWDLPFELMCDASDFAIGAVLGQRKNKHFQPIHYASKTMTEAQAHYTTTEKELLAVVYAFEKFRSLRKLPCGELRCQGECHFQQKNKIFKMLKHYFWDDFLSKSVRINDLAVLCTVKEALDILGSLHNWTQRGTSGAKPHAKKGFDSGILLAFTLQMNAHADVRFFEVSVLFVPVDIRAFTILLQVGKSDFYILSTTSYL
ncbi:reverse transcriptase domain-containing protein [Tanacetum coccineum]|uniref:Reverse transcriptase domain-containing protein n=1 Tax=Tanacetum coccineum TaxID=301880 RepID=A0ABQ5C7M2_9ASTR